MPKPPGDPDTLDKVVGNFNKIAGDMNTHGGAIKTEATGMQKAWPPPSGTPATNEANTLGGFVTDYGGHINKGATALKTYSGKLRTAQSNVAGLQNKAQTADTNALADARKKHAGATDDALRKTTEYKNSFDPVVSPLRSQYQTELSNLKSAAQTCETALGNAIPGYKKGMSPADVQAHAMNDVLLKLPSAAAEQAKQDAQTFKYQMEHGFKGDDPYSKAMYERIAAESKNQAYADAFARELKADGIVNVPEALSQAGLNDSLSDGQRKSLMEAMSNIVGEATNTDNNPGHLDQGEIDKLVKYASDTDAVDPGHPGGQWRRSWAMAELLGYSGNWSPTFLSRVSGEIYDHRYALQNQQQLRDEMPISSADNGYIHVDEMVTALQKLDKNPDAGRLFFDQDPNSKGEPDRIRTLMEEYSRTDHFKENLVADTIRAAAVDGLPDDKRTGDMGHRAANIASWFLHDASEEAQGHGAYNGAILWPGTQKAVTAVLTSYYGDLHRTLQNGDKFDPGTGSYMVTKDGDPIFAGQYGANLSFGDASQLLSSVMHDDGQKTALYQAAGIYNDMNLTYAQEHGGDVRGTYFHYGTDLKRMIESAHVVDANNAAQEKEFLQAVQVGSSAAGVFMPGEAEVGASAAKGLSLLKSLGDSGVGLMDPTGAESDEYQSRLTDATNGADNEIISSMMKHHLFTTAIPDIAHQTDPSHPTYVGSEGDTHKFYWTDDKGHDHTFVDPKTGKIDPPPQSSGDYSAFKDWYNDALADGHGNDYRQSLHDGFDHPPN
ncbi:MAG TPA: hypothetical protein VHC49_14935 [Mycobacteriales bacterium]|nr:hypothetical protein [Mycobacteriales bacterium]